MNDEWSAQHFVEAIKGLPESVPLEKKHLLRPRFRLFRDKELEIYYAPFDHLNLEARVIIVGITPGWTQMEIAFRQARQSLLRGLSFEEACREAKQKARFAGTMRVNLIVMLDTIGLPAQLQLQSSATLFEPDCFLLHSTSVVCYPVFVGGNNYSGHAPKLLSHKTLRDFVESKLLKELQAIPNALVVPLGKAVAEVLEHLAARGELDPRRCLLGFPHPSGANRQQIRQLQERKEQFEHQLDRWFDEAKAKG